MKKGQKGQDIVEFALLLPVFLVIITGIIYVGFFFGDYMTLSNIARSAAREAAVTTTTKTVPDGKGGTEQVRDYSLVIKAYDELLSEGIAPEGQNDKKPLITSLYVYTKGSLQINQDGKHRYEGGPSGSLEVVIPMTLNRKAGFVNILANLGILSDKDYVITYYMYDENPVSG